MIASLESRWSRAARSGGARPTAAGARAAASLLAALLAGGCASETPGREEARAADPIEEPAQAAAPSRQARAYDVEVIQAGEVRATCLENHAGLAGFLLRIVMRAPAEPLRWSSDSSRAVDAGGAERPLRAIMPLESSGVEEDMEGSVSVCGGVGVTQVGASEIRWGAAGQNTYDLQAFSPSGMTYRFQEGGRLSLWIFYDAGYSGIRRLLLPGGLTLDPQDWNERGGLATITHGPLTLEIPRSWHPMTADQMGALKSEYEQQLKAQFERYYGMSTGLSVREAQGWSSRDGQITLTLLSLPIPGDRSTYLERSLRSSRQLLAAGLQEGRVASIVTNEMGGFRTGRALHTVAEMQNGARVHNYGIHVNADSDELIQFTLVFDRGSYSWLEESMVIGSIRF